MRTVDYWNKRAEQIITYNEKNSNKYLNKINNAYKNTANNIAKDIEKLLKDFKVGITEAQAKEWLNESIPMYEYNKLRDMVFKMPQGEYKELLIKRLNAQALKYRITRKRYIKDDILAHLGKTANIQLDVSAQLYKDTVKYSYTKTMYNIQKGVGIGFTFDSINKKAVDKIINAKLYGKNFSKRIWSNTVHTANKSYDIILNGMLQGDSIVDMSRELKEYSYNNSMFNATRLVRTEVNYFSNQGTLQSYQEAEIDKYEYLATLDMRTSNICSSLDGKTFNLDNAEVGINYPPMHPYCRSTTIPMINSFGIKRMDKRRARDKQGKPIIIDKMNYQQWANKFIL